MFLLVCYMFTRRPLSLYYVCECQGCDIVFLVMQGSGACSICVVHSKWLMYYKKWLQVQSLSICMHGYCVALPWIWLHENTIFEI